MSGDKDILLRDVDMAYVRGHEQVAIFSRLSLAIPSQDFVAIMGPSGSGKTTLLNLLGGLDRPQSGSVLVGGTAIEKLSERERTRWRSAHIGFISQFYNLMPVLSAAENIELPLLLKRLSKRERREIVAKALSLVGLQERATHRPSQLSGGQQQRVAIARAIVSDPDIILADEPTGDLDRETAKEIMLLLQDLNGLLGKTIVLVTHDPGAARYAKRTLHLDKGHFSERLEQAA